MTISEAIRHVIKQRDGHRACRIVTHLRNRYGMKHREIAELVQYTADIHPAEWDELIREGEDSP